ncbi:18S rRNA (guanine(1575)-N(7))-methyltransferase [Elysia marginata]|uniref:18S rRNA (Guanine(1575)-N(7))-methyltransferase n=1 Tax=Elysia marginata TaxID=1093978 RepID=A0AAV4EIT1_9GAST|nr:18S rRNA (guanine(1575)-N(7))-methyltransferase [Elysia marginata]
MTLRRQIWKTRYSHQQCLHMIRWYRKRYASLHNQDIKAFIFPNTEDCSVSLPHGIKVCNTLADFKIKNLKGGFQRRPELILQRAGATNSNNQAGDLCVKKNNTKIERIQHELVTAALKLIQGIQFAPNDSQIPRGSANPDNIDNELQHTAHQTLPLIVDIGCGRGYSLKPLLEKGHSCIGVDLDLLSLQKTKMNLPHPVLRSSFKAYRNGLSKQTTLGECVQISNNAKDEQKYDLNEIPKTKHCSLPVRNNTRRHLDKLEPWAVQLSHSFSDYKSLNARSEAADVVRWDLRHGLPFKPNSFDLAISISFLQWLFYGDSQKQLNCFFASLKSILCPGGQAVIQFYPQNRIQLENAVQHAMQHFHGIVVGDYPHLDRGRKLFMVLFPLRKTLSLE